MRSQQRGGSLFGPVVLIGLGVIFLLHNFDLVAWDLWSLIQRFWPILLVAAGLDIWNRKRSLLNALALVVATVALLFAIGIGIRLADGQIKLGGNIVRTEINQPLAEAALAEVTIGLDAGTLNVAALPRQTDALITGTIYIVEDNAPNPVFHRAGETAYYILRSQGVQLAPLLERWDGEDAWQLYLNPDIPMQLRVEAGVGLNTLDLTHLSLTGLNVEAGVGQTTVILPAKGQLQARVHGGLGDVIVEIPHSMAARIQVKANLVETQINGDYESRQDLYLSPDYDVAENRVDLVVSGDVGLIKVREIPPD